MRKKIILQPSRLRQIPSQFSWLDHRLVRHHHIERISVEAQSLYLFLVTVGDVHGLSYYGEDSICEYLSAMTPKQLRQAREQLLQQSLVAYEAPYYQVLDLHPKHFTHGKEVQA